MLVREKDQSIELRVLGYEYPPGWGAGMPYDTDWLNVRLRLKRGEEEEVIEDSLLRFSELNQVYDNLERIIEGMQSDYFSDFLDKRFSLSISIVEERDIYLAMAYRDGDQDLAVRQEMTSEEFLAFARDLEQELTGKYLGGQ